MFSLLFESIQDAQLPGPQRTWTNLACRVFLQLEMAIITYAGTLSIITPVQWTQKVASSGVSSGSDATDLQACNPVAQHGGVAMLALAAALHIGLHAKSERVLEAILYALLFGDFVQIAASAIIARSVGWSLNASNATGVIFRVFCLAARLALLKDLWARKRARPKRLAALAEELYCVEDVVRRSMELTAYLSQRPVAARCDTEPTSQTSEAAVLKED
ncbi:hypothetical protein Vafri_13713 [Volvox africanus]|uniref:Uncharacterized protein n=1 Tax=Volvox africanus TaxID=51714 RepID=A0A8J4F3W7_9CHLO|nr:hypothetical protein Vafri_13713 [Volvox africanus]